MSEISLVVVCTSCLVFWPQGAETAKCLDAAHHHEQREIHRHRTPVVLPDASEVIAVSFDADDPYTRERTPDFGLYLDSWWQPPWPHRHLDWPDFGVPDDDVDLVAALGEVLHRARTGEQVEIGCLGGHGRTGTALACLAVLSGHPAGAAVAWVRANYCAKAVETDEQAAFVEALDREGTHTRGEPT